MPPDAAPRFLAFRGFFYPFRAFRFLFSHPRLWTYAVIPVGVNTLLYSLLLWFVANHFSGWLDQIVPRGDAWYWALLTYVAGALLAGLIVLAVVYTFTIVGNLLLAPFNDLLSEKVEWVYSGSRLEEPFSFAALARDTVRSVRAELGRLALFGTGFLLLLALNLFPPMGTAVYGVAAPVYTLFFLGWAYRDYSMGRWHFPFAAQRRLAFGNLLTFLGFGAGAGLLLLVPLLNLLAIPVCVAGATLLFCDLRSAGRLPPGTAAPAQGRAVETP